MTIQIGRLGSIVLSVFVMAGTAGAADLHVATTPPPAFNWSGCYVGGHGGGARSDGDITFTDLGNAQVRAYLGGVGAGRVENQHSVIIVSGGSGNAGGMRW